MDCEIDFDSLILSFQSKTYYDCADIYCTSAKLYQTICISFYSRNHDSYCYTTVHVKTRLSLYSYIFLRCKCIFTHAKYCINVFGCITSYNPNIWLVCHVVLRYISLCFYDKKSDQSVIYGHKYFTDSHIFNVRLSIVIYLM